MKKNKSAIAIIFIIILLLVLCSGCTNKPAGPIQILLPTNLPPPPSIASSSTPDPCSKGNIMLEAKKITNLTNNFDDITLMSQSTPKEQLAVVILEMRRIRRDSEELNVPICLMEFKQAQVNFMNSVISAMTNYMGGVSGLPLQNQINVSRELRVKYEETLSVVSGIPYATPTPIPPTPIIPTSTAAPVTAKGTQDIYVLDGPGLTYTAKGTFLKNQTANIVGRTKNSDWLQVEIWDNPGKPAWVPKQMVYVTGSLDTIPIVETQPGQ